MRASILPLPLLGRKPKQDKAPRASIGIPAAPGLPVRDRDDVPWPPLWWLGVHGGAGATTLTTATGLGADADGTWPAPPASEKANVVLVARACASGLWAVTGAIEQTLTPQLLPEGVRLLGVAVVAAAPGKPPRLVTDRLALLRAWTTVWTVGWIDAYLCATNAAEIGAAPPDLARLTDAVTAALETPQSDGRKRA